MKIIRAAQSQARKKLNRSNPNYVYYEKHHILPKSLFPLWTKRKSNIVLLTAREHFFCHQLLDKIYPDGKMFLALWILANDNQNKYCVKSSHEYEKIRARYSRVVSERFTGGHQNLGRVKTEEERAQLRVSCLGVNKGRVRYNNGVIERRFHKHETIPEGFVRGGLPAHFEKLKGIAISKEAKKKLSKSITGRHFFTNGIETRFLKECPPGWKLKSMKRPAPTSLQNH
jgi:hypothetical protein